MNRFYVYAHVRPDNTIFYIGKGTRKRAWSEQSRNVYWQRVVSKDGGYSVILLADYLTQQQAIEEEARAIAHFKKFGALTNILDRGDISPTSNPVVAAKVSQSATRWQTGRKLSATHRASISAAQLGKPKAAQSKTMKAKGWWAKETNPWFGQGEKQAGTKNHMAVAIVGVHPIAGERKWGTMKSMADELGVSLAAVSRAVKKQGTTKGWVVRRVV